jgi:hypothetical protein
MKIGLLTFYLLLSSSFASYAMLTTVIKMPSAEVLRKRLEERGLKKFIDTSDIIDYLADQEDVPYGIFLKASLSIRDFIHLIIASGSKGVGVGPAMQTNGALILSAAFQDHPDALQALEKEKLYRSEYTSPERRAALSQWLEENAPQNTNN